MKGDLEALCHPLALTFEPTHHPALHPGRAARMFLDGEPVGWSGELHPRWQRKYELPLAPVMFELDVQHLQRVPVPNYREVSRFPPLRRDLALVVDEKVTSDALLRVAFDAPHRGSSRRSACSTYIAVRAWIMGRKALRSGFCCKILEGL